MSEHIRLSLAHVTRLFAAACAVCLLLIVTGATSHTAAQGVDRIERERAQQMLSMVKNDIKKNYYDPQLRGIDIDARFKAAEEKMKQAQSIAQIFGIIAQAVMDFNDSHTRFNPPSTNISVNYGFLWQMIGDNCYVTEVKPDSDAARQGLKPGDQIIGFESFRPARKEMWKLNYYYYRLSPRAGLRLVVQSPNENQPRQLDIKSKVTQSKRVLDFTRGNDLGDYFREGEDAASLAQNKHRFITVGSTIVWKMPDFVVEPDMISKMVGEQLRNKGSLVLDLRGNPGGYVVALERLAGYFFDRDVKIADLKGRKEMNPILAKTRGSNVFKGKVIVLIDGESGSAAEIFARLMQLEKRGTVIGDQSSGAVMQSQSYSHELGGNSIVIFGASITNADVIMSDGKSVEHVGVTPDEKMLLTGADLAARRDPVMARALALLGTPISAEKAGQMFPFEWGR